MDLPARPTIATTIALASAAAIATGPMVQLLPDLPLAKHLPEVSLSSIQLTDAASGMMDLFAGVENQLATLASGAAAAEVPAAVVSNAVNPIQTWITTFANAGTNLQNILSLYGKAPFPILQQVAANGVEYASEYVGSYQTAATSAVKYFTGTTSYAFGPLIQSGLTNLRAGQIATSVTNFYDALYLEPFTQILQPLESILNIPTQITANVAAGTKYFDTGAVVLAGLWGGINLPNAVQSGLGNSFQAVSDAWVAGDPVGVLTNLINSPGAVTNAFLNGIPSFGANIDGLLSFQTVKGANAGLLNIVLNTIEPAFAKAIVTPNAQNIGAGGSLVTAFQNFANQLISGWPSLAPLASILNSIPGQLASLLQNIPSTLAGLPSMLGTLAGQVGTLLINLLKLL